MIKQIVAQYIEKEKLITLHDKVLVTLSGGADSVALLRILLSLGYNCEAAHCNFQLRGEESNRDEIFVRQLCRKLNIPLHVTCFDTKVYAQDKKISIEMAARKLRYRWFNALTEKHNYTAVAVAHHKDDSVETILLNLIRGTGINGLLGIRPKNGNIVRPLLCITHEDITRYLLYIQQDYVTDSTNLEDEFTRNKIRLKLLPLMQELNPSVKEKLVQTTNHLNEVAAIYHHGIEEGKARVQTEKGIHILRLLSELSPHALLFEILYPLGFNTSQIEDIMQSATGQSGKQFISNQHWRVVKDRELFLINRLEVNESSTPPFKLHFEEKQYTPCFNIIKDKHIAYFDADKLTGEFNIRKWKQGDIFIPFGMKGIKRISDFLTDRKYSIVQKEDLWVLCTGEKIAWVIGERTDNRFRIDESTRRVIIVRLQKQ